MLLVCFLCHWSSGKRDVPLSVDSVLLFAVSTSERDIVLCAAVMLASTLANMKVKRCILMDKNGVTSSHELRY